MDDAPVRGLRLGGGDERALPHAARARPDRAVDRLRPAHAARLRLRRPARRRRGRPHGRRDRLDRRHGGAPRRHPARRGLDVDDDQRAGALLLLLYELVAEEQGVPGTALRGTVQNDILKEYVARGNYIFPPRPSMRLTTDLFAYCAERIPSWNTISISGYHIREAGSTAVQELAFTLANGIAYCEAAVAAGLSPDDFGARLVVLLQRAQRLLPGGREVPRRAPAVGDDHARPLRRDEREGAGAPLPRADGGLDADGAAAGEQHRARRGAGALRRLRRRPVAAHERLRRGARAADRARRDDRAAHAADPDARGRHDEHRRPARGLVLRRGADRRARGAGTRAHRTDRRARRRGGRDRAGLRPGRDRGVCLPLPGAGRARRRGGRRRQPLHPGVGARRRAPPPRSGVRGTPARAHSARPGRARRNGGGGGTRRPYA